MDWTYHFPPMPPTGRPAWIWQRLSTDRVILGVGERQAIPTGFAMALPAGYEARIRPRSGLALKHGVTVANAPGTIDSDYRGEFAILLVNLGDQDFTIARGMRIAQMVVAPVAQVTLSQQSLADTDRGDAGFGSTGYR